jgi:Protein of unknown function (DUF3551)
MIFILQRIAGRSFIGLQRMKNGSALLFLSVDSAVFHACPFQRARGRANLREKKMKQLLKLATAPAAGLLALALTGITTPATAAKYEYCRTDVSSAMRSCSFETLEQCQTMSSGRGGTCARDPFLPEAKASDAFAYQPKGGVHRARKPAH